MKIDRTVFLIGFMGSGKTYWGARVAETAGIPFYDLDALIEARESKSVQGIFAQAGEDTFREIERDTLHQCQSLPPALIATGGGTPCFFNNMDWMNNFGRTIYLKTAPTLLAERLKKDQQFRPLLAKVGAPDLESRIATLLVQREPYYEQATVILEQGGDETAFFEILLAEIKG